MTTIRINRPLLIGLAHLEAGECVPVDEARAEQLISEGVAERAEAVPVEPPPLETATIKRPAERATRLVGKSKS